MFGSICRMESLLDRYDMQIISSHTLDIRDSSSPAANFNVVHIHEHSLAIVGLE